MNSSCRRMGAGPGEGVAAYVEDVRRAGQLGEDRRVAVGKCQLAALGALYDEVLGRPAESVALIRQFADRYVEIGDAVREGSQRSNLAETLSKLRRLDEARREIRRAIFCAAPFGHAAQPRTTRAILAGIDTDAGNPAVAAEARPKAVACHLALHRDGGENHDAPGSIALAVTRALHAGGPSAAASLLHQLAADPDLP